jgi:hypothetical protein
MKRKAKKPCNLTSKILFAQELPTLTLRKEIGGTIYTVTASYDGKQALTAKLLEIMMKETEETY